MTSTPVTLSFEAIDDLIYDARSGDLDALKTDLANLSKEHGCSEACIVASAIDSEPEAEGGSGSCLLHFPAANGNIEILNHLLHTLTSESSSSGLQAEQISAVINHSNHSGNTPLHWAALNTHLECVKALVEAGADISIKNAAGHDALFLAERTAWSTEEESKGGNQEGEVDEAEAAADKDEDRELSKGEQVVEWLLNSEKGAELESAVGENSNAAQGAKSGEAMDVDEN